MPKFVEIIISLYHALFEWVFFIERTPKHLHASIKQIPELIEALIDYISELSEEKKLRRQNVYQKLIEAERAARISLDQSHVFEQAFWDKTDELNNTKERIEALEEQIVEQNIILAEIRDTERQEQLAELILQDIHVQSF